MHQNNAQASLNPDPNHRHDSQWFLAGAMVIEYVGEVVRSSIVDLRERREYDARVGAGTYVFGLSPASGLSVDATRVR